MSEEERRPLIKSLSGSQLSVCGDNGNNGDCSVLLRTFDSTYGSSGKIIPFEDRITYSWSEVNAFSSDLSTSGNSCIFNCFRRSKSGVPHRKHILKNVNGVAYPGELLAILGSSGAGKTTLLNALTFRSSRNVVVTGVRCINGVPVGFSTFASQSAYVQQDDLFIGSLTVREHLVFQALVRMDKSISYKQRMKRVEEVIKELSLTKCQNTAIGIPGRIKGISGGERKRLSFAAEVLTNPHLMFCDEPTSGLDSFMALSVVQVLKSMAQMGKTIVCTIHQPSSEIFALFDKILLMAEGRTAFLGNPDEADEFFTRLEAPCPRNYNPADYYVQLLAVIPGKEESCKQAVAMISDTFENCELGVRVAVEAASVSKIDGSSCEYWHNGDEHRSPYKASWFTQFRAVLWRSWLSVMKDPFLIKVRLLQITLLALIFSAIYFQQNLDAVGVMNINGALFLFLTVMSFQNIFAVVHVFCTELPVFLREHKNGMYRTDVYFLCKTLAEMPLFTLFPLLYTGICYYSIGLNPEQPKFFIACGLVTLVSIAALSFGYMVSCISPNLSVALSVAPTLMVPFLLFGGYFLNINSIPVYLQWMRFLSWFLYGNEALMINQWEGVDYIDCRNATSACPANGRVVLEMFSFQESSLPWDLMGLGLLIVGFRLIAYISLLIKTYISE